MNLVSGLYNIAKRLAYTKLSFVKSSNKTVFADPFWIWLGNPRHKDHDKFGMRNSRDYKNADVIVLGNSQSYCKLINKEDAWPQALEKKTKYKIFNCSVNGWSILQMYLSYVRFSYLKPKYAILTVYPGFEIYEIFKTVRHSWLKNAKALRTNDIVNTPLISFKETDDARNFLSNQVDLLGHTARPEILRTMRGEGHVNTGEVRIKNTTYFVQEDWRYKSMNIENPAITLGLKLFKKIFKMLIEKCKQNDTQLIAVLIPTKEYLCFQNIEIIECNCAKEIENVARNEEIIRKELFLLFESTKVPCIDVTNALSNNLDVAFHPNTENGHYAPAGTSIIAEEISKYLKQKV